MNIKVKIFTLFPEFMKKWITIMYILYRKYVEDVYASIYAQSKDGKKGGLRIVYLTGFPRTGTTALKYYFGKYPGLEINPFDPAGFYIAWKKVRNTFSTDLLVDKSNHYIKSPNTIFKACGNHAALCCIVRDPRDSLLSIFSFPESREVPRGPKFWLYWYGQYSNFIKFAETSSYGSQIYFLRYEDFVTYPCQAKADYLKWLGIDTTAQEIDNTYELPQKREFVLDKVHNHKTITTKSLQRWEKEEIPENVAPLLQGWKIYPQVRELMSDLGYGEDGLESPKIRPINFKMFMPES